MRSNILLLLVLVVAGAGLLSAQQVATATAPGVFLLNNVKVDPKGVPSWPLKAGDELTAETFGVTLNFPDGSKITLQPHSKARVEVQAGSTLFRLLECGAFYELSPTSTLQLFAIDKPVQTTDKTGKFSLSCAVRPAGKFWTGKTTAITLGAAGAAAGLGIGIAASGNDGTSVSPRQ